jgi:hypothetical protein
MLGCVVDADLAIFNDLAQIYGRFAIKVNKLSCFVDVDLAQLKGRFSLKVIS